MMLMIHWGKRKNNMSYLKIINFIASIIIVLLMLSGLVSAEIRYCDKCWILENNSETIFEEPQYQIKLDEKIPVLKLTKEFKADYTELSFIEKNKEKEKQQKTDTIKSKFELSDKQLNSIDKYPVKLYYKNCTFDNETFGMNCTLIDYSYKLKQKTINSLTEEDFDFSQIPFEDNLVLKIGFDTISYVSGTNKITVVGYSEATPANFDDIYNAEIDTAHAAGWAEWYRIKASDSYNANGAVTGYNQPKPLDFGAITLYLRITALTGTSFTLNVEGTDANGNAISVALTGLNTTGEFGIGNGAVGSQVLQAFKTITSISISDAVGFAAGNCSGADSNCCTGYCEGADMECCMMETPDECGSKETCEGCGGTWVGGECDTQAGCEFCGGTWTPGTGVTFEIYQKRWGVVGKYGDYQYEISAKVDFGDGSTLTYFADTEKQVRISVSFSNWDTAWTFKNNCVANFGRLVDANIYHTDRGVAFSCAPGGIGYLINAETGSTVNLYSCFFTKSNTVSRIKGYINRLWNCQTSRIELNELINTSMYNNLVQKEITDLKNCTINKLTTFSDTGLILFYHTATIKNLYGRNQGGVSLRTINLTDGDIYLIDADLNSWAISWSTTPNKKIYRQYTFNLKVTDKDGNNIDGASVKIWDKDDNLIVDTTTSSGVIAEQTITRGYYNQANGDTLQDKSPHTISISHQDYPTREFEFTLDKKIDWTIALKDRPDNLGYMTVFGTEYCENDLGEARVFIRYGNETPADSATVSIKLWNGTWDTMTFVENGMYQFNFTAPTYMAGAKNVYFFYINSTNPTAWGTGEFTVKNCDKLTTSQNTTLYNISDNIISTNSTIHTKLDSIITSLSTMVSDIWNYGTRTLSNINYNIFSNWNTLQTYLWNATDRNLTVADWTTDSDLTNLATQSNLIDLQTHGDNEWTTATGFATQNPPSQNLDDYKANITTLATQDNISSLNQTTNLIRASQQADFRIIMSDFKAIVAGNIYYSQLNSFNYEGAPTNLSAPPTITIYDALRNTIVNEAQLNYVSNGLYTYDYTTSISATGGLWESIVTCNYSGNIVQLNDYWQISSSPADVEIIKMIDTTITTIVAETEITNMGTQASDFEYVFCIVASPNHKCGDGHDIDYQSGTRYILAGHTWNANLGLEVTNEGVYYFKLKAKALSETNWAGASEMFNASFTSNAHYVPPVSKECTVNTDCSVGYFCQDGKCVRLICKENEQLSQDGHSCVEKIEEPEKHSVLWLIIVAFAGFILFVFIMFRREEEICVMGKSYGN